MKKSISILECTVRDGSYLIDNQFTAEDTYIICTGLERAGFKLIEIGHGTGLRSSSAGMGKAAASDEEYLEAARAALSGTSAMFGMFFIPGIGRMEDLDFAASYGMGFVRIGTNITEIDQAKPYIEHAKSLGMVVSSNLMKSYAVPIDEFVKLAKKADEFGADIVAVVDSAGGMFPEEVGECILRLKDVSDKEIGYHGHNNLQLAIANTLKAVEQGASVVDSSLQGMGRSAGNTQTEILVMILEKMGYQTGIDAYSAMDLGERLIKPMMNREQGVDDMSVVAGIAQFHSSFSRIIDAASEKYKVDPRMLIMEVSKIDRINVSEELAEKTARKIKESRERGHGDGSRTISTSFVKHNRSVNSTERAMMVVDEMTSRSKKSAKESVFSLTLSQKGDTSFPFIRESASMVIGNCEASGMEEVAAIIKNIDGLIDWILLDESCHDLWEFSFESVVKASSFAWYSEKRALRSSLCTLISIKRPRGKVLLFCDVEDGALTQLALKQHGIEVVLSSAVFHGNPSGKELEAVLKEIDTVVSSGRDFSNSLVGEHVNFMGNQTYIYAVRPHAFSQSFWEAAVAKGLPMYRVDTRCGFASELALVVESKKLVDSMEVSNIAGTLVVSGGAIAPIGTVVVDSIRKPLQVIGVADGFGGVLPEKDEKRFKDEIQMVKAGMMDDLFRSHH